jgi:hypothetical protein
VIPKTVPRRVIVTTCLVIALASCESAELLTRGRPACTEIEQAIDLTDRIATLNLLATAATERCHGLVTKYGEQARWEFRHKAFSITRETASVFVPDGTLTDYILESYERGYLSILLAASYLQSGKAEEAKVELRQLDHELFAPLYNFGEDPVNLLLSAVLWEQLGETGEARVDWLRLRDLAILTKETKEKDVTVRQFAGRRVAAIDAGEESGTAWHVYAVGEFPQLDWDLQFFGSTAGYFSIRTKENFLPPCVSDTGLRLSTESWFDKIAIRHSHAYHPLLNMQMWIRLPIGVSYSLVPVAAGAGIMVGGCFIDAAGNGRGGLCALSIYAGVALMRVAPQVLEGTLRPDLRHWERVPASFVVTSASDPAQESCLTGVELATKKLI